MTWGVFRMPTEVHKAPCTPQGHVLGGHRLESICPCRPTPERQPSWIQTLWHHHDNH